MRELIERLEKPLPKEIGSMVQYTVGESFTKKTKTVIRTASGWHVLDKMTMYRGQVLGVPGAKADMDELKEAIKSSETFVFVSNKNGGKIQHPAEMNALGNGAQVEGLPPYKEGLVTKRGDWFVDEDGNKAKAEHFDSLIHDGKVVFRKKR
jgi:hypothetical protein